MVEQALSTAKKSLTIALIGNPNTGKSTLFNALSGGQALIGNFPGVTVEKKIGEYRCDDCSITLIDLPGTYSLSPRSTDEMVSVDVLLGRNTEVSSPDAVICIVDASNLERNLYLFTQVRNLNLPTVLVLNKWDLASQQGLQIDIDQLQERLGVPVITTSAHKRDGIAAVNKAVLRAVAMESSPAPDLLPAEFYQERAQLAEWLTDQGEPLVHPFLLERMLLDVRGASEIASQCASPTARAEYLDGARSRLQEAGCRIPAVETKSRYDWIRTTLDGVVHRSQAEQSVSTSDRIDRVLTHWFFGMSAFVLLMFLVFQAIYSWSGPFMDLIENFQGLTAATVEGLLPPGTLRSLLVDGLVAGVGSIIIFLPQIVILFLFIAVLEDCGYMARVAFLMDKRMTSLGLSGKSFLPLMSSFACAIPGVMATRVIESRRDRMTTMLIAPLMSCSARLPVYLLMIYTFIPSLTYFGFLELRGMLLFLMYACGVIVAIPVAWLLKKTVFVGETPPFVMELPPYKWPSLGIVLSRVYDRARAFVVRAGTLIFSVTIVVWALSYFPADHREYHALVRQAETEDLSDDELERFEVKQNALASQLIRKSYLGRAGQWIEPVVRPLGWDWRIGVGALASFPAREVIISTLGTIFSLGGDIDGDDQGLRHALAAATWPDGRPLFTIPVALSVMVFFALCAQCGATLVVIRRETNSWRWPIFTFAYMTLLAYVAAFATFQVGTAIMS